jgi:beta-1,4-mannosyltransferase
VDLLVRAFAGLPAGEWHLLLAGSASSATAAEIRRDLGARRDVTVQLRHLTPKEVADLHYVADVLAFPADHYLNSGTIYTAWSLNRPVIALETPGNLELQSLVGRDWLALFRGELSADNLAIALGALGPSVPAQGCSLDSFDPLVCADAHISAYTE